MHRCSNRSRGDFGLGCDSKYLGEPTIGPMIGRDPHGDHVFLDVLAEVDSRIEPGGDNVHAAVVGSDV